MKLKTFLFSFISCLWAAHAARILAIVPVEARSHFYFHEAVFKSLVKAGHHVTLINYYTPSEKVDNFTVIHPPEGATEDKNPYTAVALRNTDIFTLFLYMIHDVGEKECENIWKMPFIQNLFKSSEKHFDLVFVEQFFMYECILPIADKLDVPIIGTFSAVSLSVIDAYYGNPRNPATQPNELTNFGLKMSFLQRLQNVFYYLIDYYMREIVIAAKLEKIHKKHSPTFDLANSRKISLIFLNDNPSLLPRPAVPNIIHVGGIHVEMGAKQRIPENIRKFIEESKNGVILFSLGSIISAEALDEELRTVIREAFAKIPQRVIWKFDTRIPGLSDNVLVSKWLPQREILAHPKVVALMSHCGIMSTYEAIYYGKPMILTPIFADQPSTAARLLELEVGVLFDISTANAESLIKLIEEVVKKPKYAENMRRLSEAVKDLPMTPSESVVYWTDYVLRHNGALHLRTVGADMPFYQYYLLDVIGLVAAVAVLAIIIILYLFKTICSVLGLSGASKNKVIAKKKRQ